jgi:hypothetical protein
MPGSYNTTSSWSQLLDNLELRTPLLKQLSGEDVYPIDDQYWVDLFGIRNKVDLGLRRLRITDIITYNKDKLIIKNIITNVLIHSSLDYITVCNILHSVIVYGVKWFWTWFRTGCFSYDVKYMIEIMSKVSNKIKLLGCNLPDWQIYVENQGLSGYRNLPMEGFDYMEQAKDLANGGIKHWWSEDEKLFEQIVNRLLVKVPKKWNRRMSFREYLDSGIWSTSGSSTVGRVVIEIGGKLKTIKARKNMILDMYTVDELYTMCMSQVGQQNFVIVKSELGKVRLAVASDLANYLLMSYQAYCASDFYKEWEGCVSGEAPNVQFKRMLETLFELEGKWAMPYDYAGYDHQPELHELRACASVVSTVGRANVDDLEEYDKISKIIRDGWTNATLTTRNIDGFEPTTLKVTGGLMSGLYLTAILGNAWNKVATTINTVISDAPGVSYKLKGDDSSFISEKKDELQRLERGYRTMNIKGGVGKFSILQGNSEFLRVWTKANDRCYAYPGRIMPGLMQRKPWSNQPWTPTNVMDAVLQDVLILIRRTSNVVGVWNYWAHCVHRWCALHRLDSRLARIPASLGGFGWLMWDGEMCVTPRIPNTADVKKEISVRIATTYRAVKIKQRAEEAGIKLTQESVDDLARHEAGGVLVSDDYPEVSRELREHWNQMIKSYKPKFSTQQRPMLQFGQLQKMEQADDLLQHYRDATATSYGSLASDVSYVTGLKPILRAASLGLREFIRTCPRLYRLNREIAKHPRWHLAELLDWYGGSVQVNSFYLNPLVQSYFSGALMKLGSKLAKRNRVLDYLAQHLGPQYAVDFAYYPSIFRVCMN